MLKLDDGFARRLFQFIVHQSPGHPGERLDFGYYVLKVSQIFLFGNWFDSSNVQTVTSALVVLETSNVGISLVCYLGKLGDTTYLTIKFCTCVAVFCEKFLAIFCQFRA